MTWLSKLAAMAAAVAGMIGFHRYKRKHEADKFTSQVSWYPQKGAWRVPVQGQRRVRTKFAWLPVVDEDGVARWMEDVVVEEYWTYGYGKYGFRWYWEVSRIIGIPKIKLWDDKTGK